MATPKTIAWEGLAVIGQDNRRLAVELTPEEHFERGMQLARQDRAIAELKVRLAEERKAHIAQQKQEMDAATAIQVELVHAVNDGSEPRPVTCVHLADYEKRLCYTIRVDTSELVATRSLTDAEVQVQIGESKRPVIRLLPDPVTGKLQREDGRGLDTLPFVRSSQCEPQACQECNAELGQPHEEACPFRGAGAAALVTEDQCDAQTCLECGAPLGQSHEDGCPHLTA